MWRIVEPPAVQGPARHRLVTRGNCVRAEQRRRDASPPSRICALPAMLGNHRVTPCNARSPSRMPWCERQDRRRWRPPQGDFLGRPVDSENERELAGRPRTAAVGQCSGGHCRSAPLCGRCEGRDRAFVSSDTSFPSVAPMTIRSPSDATHKMAPHAGTRAMVARRLPARRSPRRRQRSRCRQRNANAMTGAARFATGRTWSVTEPMEANRGRIELFSNHATMPVFSKASRIICSGSSAAAEDEATLARARRPSRALVSPSASCGTPWNT